MTAQGEKIKATQARFEERKQAWLEEVNRRAPTLTVRCGHCDLVLVGDPPDVLKEAKAHRQQAHNAQSRGAETKRRARYATMTPEEVAEAERKRLYKAALDERRKLVNGPGGKGRKMSDEERAMRSRAMRAAAERQRALSGSQSA